MSTRLNACTGPRATLSHSPSWAVHSLRPAGDICSLGLKTERPGETFAREAGESSTSIKGGRSLDLRKNLWASACGTVTRSGREEPWEEAWRLGVWSGPTGQMTGEERLQRKVRCYRLPGRKEERPETSPEAPGRGAGGRGSCRGPRTSCPLQPEPQLCHTLPAPRD